ncbi:MAG: acetamidase [Chloroflexi bacterium]|jgi:amidase|nr:acetamidase [Chloroflexota bacterium]MBT5628635.1 acetamidase [Chloroflexota bacterium]
MPQTHEIVATTYYRTFSKSYPVLATIKPGDKVVTKTLDSGGQDLNDEHLHETGNPLTGPFYVEGAEPGDTISVKLDKLKLNRNWGYTSIRLGLVSLNPDHVAEVFSNDYKMDLVRKDRSDLLPWDIDLERNVVSARYPESPGQVREFPAEPMLGCIGVAPEGDFTPTSGPSGSYGGNIDYNMIREGSTVHLPVSQTGAYLYVGDGHALQGDGEPLGNGIETSMDVDFTVTLVKAGSNVGQADAGDAESAGGSRADGKLQDLTMPRIETDEFIISLGSQAEFSSSLNRGLQLATTDMVQWLVADYGFEDWAAHTLVGMVGQYDVVTVAGSMALRIPREHLG